VSQSGDNRVVVAGNGPAGLVCALALAWEGAAVTLVGTAAPDLRGRTTALFDGSVRLLSELGIWDELARKAAPLRRLRVIDDTGNLFRWPELSFDAREIGLEAFGWNVEASILAGVLRQACRRTDGIDIVEGLASAPFFGDAAGPHRAMRSGPRSARASRQDRPRPAAESGGPGLASVAVGDDRLEASLIVAADGQRSQLRRAAGIAARLERLPQSALVAILLHELPHDGCSTELHLRGGPCTLVPLRWTFTETEEARPASTAFAHASSLVWMTGRAAAERLAGLDDEALALAVERRVHSILGKMRVAGPCGTVPLSALHAQRIVAPRLALVGEAAHAFPPIGAQGLNLGLRDASTLAARVGEGLRQGLDIGGPAVLDLYERDRRADIATRSTAVAMLNRSLLSSFLPFDVARGLGMAALDLVPALRRLVMREGVEPGSGQNGRWSEA